MDWLKGKKYRKTPKFSWENLWNIWFPVKIFPETNPLMIYCPYPPIELSVLSIHIFEPPRWTV